MQNAGVNAQLNPALDPVEGELSDADQACQKCDEHEYLDQTEFYCKACPTESKTTGISTQQTSVDHCLCNAGYHQPDENAADTDCLPCVRGTYKEANLSDIACSLCSDFSPEHMTTAEEASTTADHCLCIAGYYEDESNVGDHCLECAAGTYKADIGNEVALCVGCGVNVYCPSPSTVETDCPADSQAIAGSTQLSDCKCNAGFHIHDDESTGSLVRECVACAAGKYQNLVGETECTDCFAGKYNELTQQDEESDCLECDATNPSYVDSLAGSDQFSDCFCVAGHFHANDLGTNGDLCAPCTAGTYRTNDMVFGGDDYDPTSYLCTDCGPDKYNDNTASDKEDACTDCPANTHTTDGATGQDEAAACHCQVGYKQTIAGDVTTLPTCEICIPGKFSTTLDANSCTDCEAGKASATQGASSETTCIDCLAGTFSADDGASICNDCGIDQYQDGTDKTFCKDCPGPTGHDSTGQDELADCKCNKGYTASAGPDLCEQCAAGTYKDLDHSNDDCTACHTVDVNSEVDADRTNSLLQSDDITDCFCIAGYYANRAANGMNTQDVSHLGKDPSDLSKNTRCLVCPAGHYCGPDVNAARFASGSGILGWQPCRGNSNSPAESSHFTHCKCNAGFYFDTVANGAGDDVANEFTACDLCRTDLDDQGFYCPPDNDEALSCGAHTASHTDHDGADGSTLNDDGSIKLAASEFKDCVCLAGYWRNCIKDTRDGASENAGRAHVLDADGDIADPLQPLEDCTRDETYFTRDCVQCPSDTACKQEEQMQHCPTHATSPPGSTVHTACKCTAGFKEVAQAAA